MKLRPIMIALVCAISSPLLASDASFYRGLLARGLAECRAGNYEPASAALRIAAFGLLDDRAAYETAQVHLAVAGAKLGKPDQTRTAAAKFMQAERLGPTLFATLELEPSDRAAFLKLLPASVSSDLIQSVARSTAAPRPPATAVPPPVEPPHVIASRDETPLKSAPKPASDRPEVSSQPVETAPTPTPQTPPPAVAQQSTAPAPAPKVVTAPQPPRAEVPPPVQSATAEASQPARTARAESAPPPQPPKVVAAPGRAAAAPAPSRTATPTGPRRLSDAPPATQINPLVAAARSSRMSSAQSTDARIAAATSLVEQGSTVAARQAFLDLARSGSGLNREQTLEIAGGLSRTTAWRDSATLYDSVQPFRSGEEMHMFLAAVDNFELGRIEAAKRLLKAAQLALPNTQEVAVYSRRITDAR